MKEFTYKEILALTLGIAVLYFILKPKRNIEVERNKRATSKKVKDSFSTDGIKDFLSENKKTQKYKSPEEYLKSLGLELKDIAYWTKEIYSTRGIFNDDEDKLFAIFQQIPTITVLSMVSNYFKRKYKKDLRIWLSEFLNEKEMQRIYSIIEKKPKF